MAETTLNYSSNIAALVGSSDLRREIFEKMNCSTETFAFATQTKAMHNFDMREYSITNMDLINDTNSSLNVKYYHKAAIPPDYPCIGNTVFNTNSWAWVIGSYWTPLYIDDPFCWRFVQIQNTMAHSAISNVAPFRAECYSARSFCFLLGADQALGETTFNSIHTNNILTFYGFGAGLQMHMTGLIDNNTLVPGDCVYMKNKNDYKDIVTNNSAANGLYAGFNCLFMGQNSSNEATFGALRCNRKTESQMREILRVNYTNDCPGHTVNNPGTEIKWLPSECRRIITGE